jgi:hypothetical protein
MDGEVHVMCTAGGGMDGEVHVMCTAGGGMDGEVHVMCTEVEEWMEKFM